MNAKPILYDYAGLHGTLLAHPVRRLLWIGVSALVGMLTCLTAQVVVASLSLTPRFPAFAGEADFDLRFRYFLFGVFPAFAALGAWIGNAFSENRRAGTYMWLGVLAGTAITFLLARLLAAAIHELSSRAAANRGVLVLFVGWVALSALGAYGAKLWLARGR